MWLNSVNEIRAATTAILAIFLSNLEHSEDVYATGIDLLVGGDDHIDKHAIKITELLQIPDADLADHQRLLAAYLENYMCFLIDIHADRRGYPKFLEMSAELMRHVTGAIIKQFDVAWMKMDLEESAWLVAEQINYCGTRFEFAKEDHALRTYQIQTQTDALIAQIRGEPIPAPRAESPPLPELPPRPPTPQGTGPNRGLTQTILYLSNPAVGQVMHREHLRKQAIKSRSIAPLRQFLVTDQFFPVYVYLLQEIAKIFAASEEKRLEVAARRREYQARTATPAPVV